MVNMWFRKTFGGVAGAMFARQKRVQLADQVCNSPVRTLHTFPTNSEPLEKFGMECENACYA